jgi:hypothetical protein
MRVGDDVSAETQLCGTLLGMAVYIFLMTFVARLPVNYPAVYAVLLALPLLIDFRGVRRRLAACGRALITRRKVSWQQGVAFALLVLVLGMHWLIVPQPESGADALAMHLAIPVNISLHHILTYQPGRILWSVMPMGADWCYTMVYLLGGEYAARLLDFCMLLLLEALLYTVVRRWVTPAIAYIILALFASTSMVQLVTGSMYVENFQAAVLLGTLVAIWNFGETGSVRMLYTAALLGGTALAIKLGGLAYVIAILPFAILEVHRQWRRLGARPALSAALAVILLLGAAVPTYAIAWRMTGSPIFPFMNQKFPSRLLDHAANIVDLRYTQPTTWHSPFDLTFHTDRYFEGRGGSLGFQYLLLAPLGLLAAAFLRRRPAGAAAAVSLVGGFIVLKLQPNARYLFPSLPLLLIPLAALLGWLSPSGIRRTLIALAVACVLLNTWFLPASNYYHGDFYERAPLSAAMRQSYMHKVAPIREIGQYMNREHPAAPVFLAEGNDLAAFNAEAYANGWHQYSVAARLRQARDVQEVYGILKGWNVRYVVAPKPGFGILINPRTLQDLLNNCTTAEYQTTDCFLARIEDGCRHANERAPLVAQPGWYDDFDPAIVFDGPWIEDKNFSQAFKHTLTYANLPGATIRFAFEGGLLSYMYTKAANRGMADVSIDGVHQGTVDLYSATTAWHRNSIFKTPRGRHLAVITVLPDKNPKSSDRYVDVDGFQVQ